MPKKIPSRSSHARLRFYTVVIGILSAALIGRLFILQIIRGESYQLEAQGQHVASEVVEAPRGEIFFQDREGNLHPVAINKQLPLIYAVPKEIRDKKGTAQELAVLLGKPVEEISAKLAKENDPYEPLYARASEEMAQKAITSGLTGVGVSYERGRFYPLKEAASHAIGFWGYSADRRVGQYGVEGYYEDALAGKRTVVEGKKSGAGYWVELGRRLLANPERGANLVLTIDANIQFKAEEILKKVFEAYRASEGTVIVSDPKSGKILAMATYPSFNLNEYGKVESADIYVNPAVQKSFEPGSIFKPITMAAALDAGVVTPVTTYHDTGKEVFGSYVIQNFDRKARGIQTMTEVLEKSLNTGAIFAERKLGHERFTKYVEGFQFGEKTGIDLAGEAAGSIENLSEKREVNYATASFGQGITVTPIQMVQAIGAIANGGTMMKPYVVERIVRDGAADDVVLPRAVGQMVQSKAAFQLSAMMTSVVEHGFDRLAVLRGYDLAGKTGTAQIPDPKKGGYSDEVIHSFVGFGPSSDPRFVIFMKLERPRGVRFASTSLARPFRDLSEYILRYYNIPPDTVGKP